MRFEWDAKNIRKVKRHGITPQEAEEAILIDPLIATIQEHETEDRLLCFGRTRAGRFVTVIYTERGGTTRVVTAYPMTKAQQKIYFEDK